MAKLYTALDTLNDLKVYLPHTFKMTLYNMTLYCNTQRTPLTHLASVPQHMVVVTRGKSVIVSKRNNIPRCYYTSQDFKIDEYTVVLDKVITVVNNFTDGNSNTHSLILKTQIRYTGALSLSRKKKMNGHKAILPRVVWIEFATKIRPVFKAKPYIS